MLSVIIPFLLILGWRFLSLRFPVALLVVLLILKLILFLISPSSGLLVKVHPNLSQEKITGLYPFQMTEKNSWVKTYATSWNKNTSGILKKPWTEKLDFPLDWALFGDLAKCGVSTIPCFNKLNPVIEIEGVLFLPKGTKFALVARGVKKGTISAINEEGEISNLLPAKSFEDAGHPRYQLPQGERWEISGKLLYVGVDWSLIPVLINPDGEISSDLGREVLWQNKEELTGSLSYIGLCKDIITCMGSLDCWVAD